MIKDFGDYSRIKTTKYVGSESQWVHKVDGGFIQTPIVDEGVTRAKVVVSFVKVVARIVGNSHRQLHQMLWLAQNTNNGQWHVFRGKPRYHVLSGIWRYTNYYDFNGGYICTTPVHGGIGELYEL